MASTARPSGIQQSQRRFWAAAGPGFGDKSLILFARLTQVQQPISLLPLKFQLRKGRISFSKVCSSTLLNYNFTKWIEIVFQMESILPRRYESGTSRYFSGMIIHNATTTTLSCQPCRTFKTCHNSLIWYPFCFLPDCCNVLHRLPGIIVATGGENTSTLQHLIRKHGIIWHRVSSSIRQGGT